MDVAQIARLEEHRQAITLSEIAGDWLEVGGGRAARGEPGIWANIAMGLGLSGQVAREEIDCAIEWYLEAGIEPRFEICPFVDEDLLRTCEAAGLVLRAFENIFCLQLAEAGEPLLAKDDGSLSLPGLEIRIVDRDQASETDAFGRVVAAGFTPEGSAVRQEAIAAYTRVARHPRTTAMLVMHEGQAIAGGALDVSGEIASLYAMSVLPEFRRRGIQQTLMAARVAAAQSQSATIATIGARPGISTERNALRQGFKLAYTKIVLVKSSPHLARVGH